MQRDVHPKLATSRRTEHVKTKRQIAKRTLEARNESDAAPSVSVCARMCTCAAGCLRILGPASCGAACRSAARGLLHHAGGQAAQWLPTVADLLQTGDPPPATRAHARTYRSLNAHNISSATSAPAQMHALGARPGREVGGLNGWCGLANSHTRYDEGCFTLDLVAASVRRESS